MVASILPPAPQSKAKPIPCTTARNSLFISGTLATGAIIIWLTLREVELCEVAILYERPCVVCSGCFLRSIEDADVVSRAPLPSTRLPTTRWCDVDANVAGHILCPECISIVLLRRQPQVAALVVQSISVNVINLHAPWWRHD